jgi:predicted transposase/invertase (TIGR01784 family)
MLPLENPVVDIEYQTGELIPRLTEVLRNTIVDVRCTDSGKRQFIVEMQLYWSESFKSRVLLNASKAYVMQLNKAEDFELLQPVYALNFVNDKFEKSPEMANDYNLLNAGVSMEVVCNATNLSKQQISQYGKTT